MPDIKAIGTFQFHKGTIKTHDFPFEKRTVTISIP